MFVLSYLAKLKRDLGLTFGAHFLHDFFHKNLPYLILYKWPKFRCHTLFLSQDVKQNMLLSSYLDKWCYHKLLRFFLNHPLKQWQTVKSKIQKFEYLKTETSFWDEIKNIFHRAITWQKIKIWWKIADTSFKRMIYFKGFKLIIYFKGLTHGCTVKSFCLFYIVASLTLFPFTLNLANSSF